MISYHEYFLRSEASMKILFILTLLVSSFFCNPANCLSANEPVGIIKSVSGEVFIGSTPNRMRAVVNMKVVQGDSIMTGENSSAGLIFEDDTVVAIGPNSEIMIETFIFNPIDHNLAFIANLIKGTFSFITGQIAKLAPQNVKFETPDATLGVRGTKFLVKIN